MAKVPSPFLTGATGKFAGAAFQQSPGNGTILREVVKPTNPSTEAQVEQRAKFKLMSQVATAFKSVIAMKREGNITPRNMFVKINSPLLFFDPNSKSAKIGLQQLQLTKSDQRVSLANSENNVFTLSADLPILYGAVFVHVNVTDNEIIAIKAIKSVELEQAANAVPATIEGVEAGDFILAYGIMQKTEDVKIKYDDYAAETDEEKGAVAYVYTLKSLAANSALTQTVGLHLQ